MLTPSLTSFHFTLLLASLPLVHLLHLFFLALLWVTAGSDNGMGNDWVRWLENSELIRACCPQKETSAYVTYSVIVSEQRWRKCTLGTQKWWPMCLILPSPSLCYCVFNSSCYLFSFPMFSTYVLCLFSPFTDLEVMPSFSVHSDVYFLCTNLKLCFSFSFIILIYMKRNENFTFFLFPPFSQFLLYFKPFFFILCKENNKK